MRQNVAVVRRATRTSCGQPVYGHMTRRDSMGHASIVARYRSPNIAVVRAGDDQHRRGVEFGRVCTDPRHLPDCIAVWNRRVARVRTTWFARSRPEPGRRHGARRSTRHAHRTCVRLRAVCSRDSVELVRCERKRGRNCSPDDYRRAGHAHRNAVRRFVGCHARGNSKRAAGDRRVHLNGGGYSTVGRVGLELHASFRRQPRPVDVSMSLRCYVFRYDHCMAREKPNARECSVAARQIFTPSPHVAAETLPSAADPVASTSAPPASFAV